MIIKTNEGAHIHHLAIVAAEDIGFGGSGVTTELRTNISSPENIMIRDLPGGTHDAGRLLKFIHRKSNLQNKIITEAELKELYLEHLEQEDKLLDLQGKMQQLDLEFSQK